MLKFRKQSIYDIQVYSFFTTDRIPYQLTFDRSDMESVGVNVHLQNLKTAEETEINHDIRKVVCDCFKDYFTDFTEDDIRYEIEITHKRNLLKLFKFLRWAGGHDDLFDCEVEIIKTDGRIFAEVKINRK